MINAAINYLRRFGIRKTLRRALQSRISRFSLYREAVRGKDGLEIGGPSPMFQSRVPHRGRADVYALDAELP
jgi:hypothetical protein